MTVRLRLARVGGSEPIYRIVAAHIKSRRDGKHLEKLGTYDPVPTDGIKCVNLKTERIKYWIGNGAQPSKTVSRLLSMAGILPEYPIQRKMNKEEYEQHLEEKKKKKEFFATLGKKNKDKELPK
eukprot:NODE_111_length_18624_cov_1.285020.p16 type:complete len:124 gc:universal NODE_111_length_18624_cov_1.285020:550-921(+)